MTYAGKLFWQQVSNGHWALGRETRLIASVQELGIRRTLPHALCPMPYALYPIPNTFEKKIHCTAHIRFYWLSCGFEDQCII